ncbi:hypothetical protein [Corynebacterium mayonis]|uniref:hypothetical protein n=1 Tax=Corynebacterium mayonis TaxID=3062461 RepID=UPI003140A578
MSSRPQRFVATAATLLSAMALTACLSEADVGAGQSATDIEVTTPTAVPEEEFRVNDVNDQVTDQILGQKVKDPGMELSYQWQGTRPSPNGSTTVIIAVTNESDVPMPVNALGEPRLTYVSGGNNKETARLLNAEQSGLKIVGLDMPLGPGATANVQYPFNVSVTNLGRAQFSIGNITFEGNLNN